MSQSLEVMDDSPNYYNRSTKQQTMHQKPDRSVIQGDYSAT